MTSDNKERPGNRQDNTEAFRRVFSRYEEIQNGATRRDCLIFSTTQSILTHLFLLSQLLHTVMMIVSLSETKQDITLL